MRTSAAALELDFTEPSITAAKAVACAIAQNGSLQRDTLLWVMEEAHGGFSADGRWSLRDAYDLLELAEVMHLGNADLPSAPQDCLAALTALVANLPTHTVRSEEQIGLQQFSTPAPIAYLASPAAHIAPTDLVLEPSAGTGLLAVFAQRTGARLVLNEIDPARAEMLAAAFPGVAVTRHDAELIHDLLAPTVRPTAVLINPPFSRSIGRHADPLAAFRHLRAALMRLGAGGRCAAILLDRVSTSSRAWANRRGRDRQHHRVAMISLIERKGRGSHDPCDIDITWRSEPRFRPPSMAHAKDVAAVIQSALDEIGVTGQFDVSMDGEKAIKPLGTPSGDDRHVDVVVDDLLKKTAKPTGDD